jgi:hypothetical protein
VNASQPVKKRMAVPAFPTKIGTSFADIDFRGPMKISL